MGRSPRVKMLKNGKISFRMEADLRELVSMAIRARLFFDREDLEDYLYFLLDETLQRIEKADGDRVQLRRSEYLAVFHPDIMQYLDEPVQWMIRQAIEMAPTLPAGDELEKRLIRAR